jgi:hypothetical protein
LEVKNELDRIDRILKVKKRRQVNNTGGFFFHPVHLVNHV